MATLKLSPRHANVPTIMKNYSSSKLTRRNNLILSILIIFVMEILYFNCGLVESSEASYDLIGQWKCKSSSTLLLGKLESKYEIFKNPKMPNFECERVILPDSSLPLNVEEFWHVEDYPTVAFPENSDMNLKDICQSFKIVEERNNLTCNDLCENYAYNRSEIFDFINYCKYCSNAKGYDSFNDRIVNNNCRNSNSTIRSMLESFPRDMRFCGHSNFGLPFISPYLDYSYLCYCASSNIYGMGCKKRALTSFILDFTAYTGIVSFSALTLTILFASLIPKIINLLQKNRDRNQYSLMRLLPTLSIFLASILRVLSLICELLNWISVFRYLSTISEFVNYFALIPILVNLYGLMKYVKTQKRPNALLSYCLTFSIFIILITCCILISVIFQYTVGPVYMIIGWISVSWGIEFLIHAACFLFLVVIYFTLKKISDVSAFDTKYFKLGALCIGILQAFTAVDLNLLAAKLTDELALYTLLRSCAIVLAFVFSASVLYYEFNKEDFTIIIKRLKKKETADDKTVSLISSSSTSEEGNSVNNSNPAKYYSL